MNPKMLAIVLVLVLVAAVMFWPVGADTVNDPVSEGEASEDDDLDPTIGWAKIDFYWSATGPAGTDRAGPDNFDFKSIKVSKGKYFGQSAPSQSMFSLMTQSLKWGTHEWTTKIRVVGPETDMTWTSESWKQDLPEAKTTTLSYATDVFYLSHPGSYLVTLDLIPIGAYAYDTAGKVMASGEGTFTIPAVWGE